MKLWLISKEEKPKTKTTICETDGCNAKIKKPFVYKGKKLCRDCWEEWQALDKMKKVKA